MRRPTRSKQAADRVCGLSASRSATFWTLLLWARLSIAAAPVAASGRWIKPLTAKPATRSSSVLKSAFPNFHRATCFTKSTPLLWQTYGYVYECTYVRMCVCVCIYIENCYADSYFWEYKYVLVARTSKNVYFYYQYLLKTIFVSRSDKNCRSWKDQRYTLDKYNHRMKNNYLLVASINSNPSAISSMRRAVSIAVPPRIVNLCTSYGLPFLHVSTTSICCTDCDFFLSCSKRFQAYDRTALRLQTVSNVQVSDDR